MVLAVLPVIFISACSGGSNINSTVSKEETPKSSIEVWCSADMKDNITYAAGLFCEKNPQVSISVTSISGNGIDNDLKARAAAGASYPDLIEVNTHEISFLVDKYPEVFLDIDNEVKKIGDKLLPWKLQEVTVNKKIYAFPWDSDPKVILYNKNLADRYNINPADIKTWDDFQSTGDMLNTKTAGKVKLIALKESASGEMYKSMMRELGSGLYKNNGAIVIPKDETLKVLTKVKQMYDKKMIYEIKDKEEPLALLKNGSAISIIADGQDIKKISESQDMNKIKWQVEKFPAFENGGKNAVCGEGNAVMVVKKSSTNDAALKFTRFLLTDNESNIFAFKNNAVIASTTDLYSLPLLNQVPENYNGIRVWRFMAEEGREETAITYDPIYDKISSRLIQLERDVLKGKDPKELIKSAEDELNKP